MRIESQNFTVDTSVNGVADWAKFKFNGFGRESSDQMAVTNVGPEPKGIIETGSQVSQQKSPEFFVTGPWLGESRAVGRRYDRMPDPHPLQRKYNRAEVKGVTR